MAPLYRHREVGLLRAAAMSISDIPGWWPNPDDMQDSRNWLDHIWGSPTGFADAVRQASPDLADAIDDIRTHGSLRPKQIRRATLSTIRYAMRATGRSTPFGRFAGVASASLGSTARVRWSTGHRVVARADASWVADLIDRFEVDPELLARLDVTCSDLAERRGDRLELPKGPTRVSIRHTAAVQTVQAATSSAIRVDVLVDKLNQDFPGGGRAAAHAMVASLVQQGFLITCLRATMTDPDPLGHLVDRLRDTHASSIPALAPLVNDVETIHRDLSSGQAQALAPRMRALSPAGRTPLAEDLRLDCAIRVPRHVGQEVAEAASVLLRLTRRPTGEPAWLRYFAAFVARYGTGTLVPVTEVVDTAAGLGYPASYPESVFAVSAETVMDRDEQLLRLAWQALADNQQEIVLTADTIRALTGDSPFDERHIPPHVEVATRIHAASRADLEQGDYTLTISPARAVGTLTGRFTHLVGDDSLTRVFRTVPTIIDGALLAQMSFPPIYPHAQNVSRVPAHLPHVLTLGEHRHRDAHTINIDDLAVTATRNRLHLVSTSRQQVVEPQVFTGLALEKQPPPLARFLAHLARGSSPGWHEFDWGSAARRLPFLPRVRYGRTIISPASWRLSAIDLPPEAADDDQWRQALDRWRHRWSCPETVELRDNDRSMSLRLTFTEPAHVAVLRAHLRRRSEALFVDAVPEGDLGWIGGHVHELVLPLVRSGPPAPNPLTGPLPRLTNGSHGQLPGAAPSRWLNVRLHAHPNRLDAIIVGHLPELLTAIGHDTPHWFIRYRSLTETDHLRLRIRTTSPDHYATCISAVGDWAQRLRATGTAGDLAIDTYHPEVGRYGHGPAMLAAEEVFVADSRVAAVGLRHLPPAAVSPTALCAANMLDIARGLLGDDDALRWLIDQPAPVAPVADRAVFEEAIALVQRDSTAWPPDVAVARQARAAALATYRRHLPDRSIDPVLESLLHMHHNRATGVDPDGEAVCRRLARQLALSHQARQQVEADR
ncbi:lantibiotic dehydratase [Micromonospora sonneratiae]|uniref:Lantibiotic dehydratase n=1 Tax=Micromonospora sonneratiae TaxID=1184706 RepID=A0ABW3YAM0_9ACTN